MSRDPGPGPGRTDRAAADLRKAGGSRRLTGESAVERRRCGRSRRDRPRSTSSASRGRRSCLGLNREWARPRRRRVRRFGRARCRASRPDPRRCARWWLTVLRFVRRSADGPSARKVRPDPATAAHPRWRGHGPPRTAAAGPPHLRAGPPPGRREVGWPGAPAGPAGPFRTAVAAGSPRHRRGHQPPATRPPPDTHMGIIGQPHRSWRP